MIEKLPYPIKHKIHIYLSNRKVITSQFALNLSPEVAKWERLHKLLKEA